MISDEAVEVAAKALYERDKALIVPWGDSALPDIRAYRDEARAALEAAAPYVLREAKEAAYDEGFEDGKGRYNENPYRSQG